MPNDGSQRLQYLAILAILDCERASVGSEIQRRPRGYPACIEVGRLLPLTA
jgi:hypothetical protein